MSREARFADALAGMRGEEVIDEVIEDEEGGVESAESDVEVVDADTEVVSEGEVEADPEVESEAPSEAEEVIEEPIAEDTPEPEPEAVEELTEDGLSERILEELDTTRVAYAELQTKYQSLLKRVEKLIFSNQAVVNDVEVTEEEENSSEDGFTEPKSVEELNLRK